MHGAARAPAELFVVVPFYNEERGLPATLRALAAQSDRAFSLVLVDNASTDGGAAIARDSRASVAPFPVHRDLHEAQKGTGAACRHRLPAGHLATAPRWIARTDADCVPRARLDPQPQARARSATAWSSSPARSGHGADEALTLLTASSLPAMIWVAEHYGRLHRRGPQFRYPYFMAAGNNLAITARRCTRRAAAFRAPSIEECHEDRALSEKVRTLTTRAAVRAGRRSSTTRCAGCAPTATSTRCAGTGTTATARASSTCDEAMTVPRRPAEPGGASGGVAAGAALARDRPGAACPGFGVVVNDFELAHEILVRDDDFTKNGKGSIAGVMTQALGPFALSNMDGEAHRQLRANARQRPAVARALRGPAARVPIADRRGRADTDRRPPPSISCA